MYWRVDLWWHSRYADFYPSLEADTREQAIGRALLDYAADVHDDRPKRIVRITATKRKEN